MNSRLLRLIEHMRKEHVDSGVLHEAVPLPVTDTPSVIDSTPIQGQHQSVPYTFNPADNEYTCGICQSQVGSRACFLSHIKELHADKRPKHQQFVIPDRPNTFKYNGHGLKLNDEDQCYYCDACDFKGNTYLNSVLAHIRALHYTEEDKVKFTAVPISETEWLYGGTFKIIRVGEKFKCVSCGCVTFHLNELSGHIRSEHVDMEGNPQEVPLPVIDSPSVGDSTLTQGEYKSVPYTFNPINNKFTCGICQLEVTSTRKQIFSHIRERHLAPTQVACEICGKELSNQRGYREHLKRPQAEPKSCPRCDKKFYCPKSLNIHLKIHKFGEAVKKYQCEYCGKKFRLRAEYTNHARVHTGEMPFVCEVCGRNFHLSSELSAHRDSVHGIARETRKLMRINE